MAPDTMAKASRHSPVWKMLHAPLLLQVPVFTVQAPPAVQVPVLTTQSPPVQSAPRVRTQALAPGLETAMDNPKAVSSHMVQRAEPAKAGKRRGRTAPNPHPPRKRLAQPPGLGEARVTPAGG